MERADSSPMPASTDTSPGTAEPVPGRPADQADDPDGGQRPADSPVLPPVLPWDRLGTLPWQVAGLALVVVPALARPLPVTGSARTAVMLTAVVVGFAGLVIVFGGLLHRVTTVPARTAAPAPSDETREIPLLAGPGRDDAAPAAEVRHLGPAVYWALTAVGIGLSVATGVVAYLLLTGAGGIGPASVLMFGLPAAALCWVTWHGQGAG